MNIKPEHMQALKAAVTSFGADILQLFSCCAFDDQKDLGGLITPDLFFGTVYVASKKAESLAEKIRLRFASMVASSQVVIVHGFAGTGKTVFMRYLQHHACDKESVLIDFGVAPTAKDQAPEEHPEGLGKAISDLLKGPLSYDKRTQLLSITKKEPAPIAEAVREHITGDPKTYRAAKLVLTRIRKHQAACGRYFSDGVAMCLSEMSGRLNQEDFGRLLGASTARDVVLFFILSICMRSMKNPPMIVFMDNLDRVDLDYLSERFRNDFSYALESASALFHLDKIGLRLNVGQAVRFVFCVRDATYAVMDLQQNSTWGAGVTTIAFPRQIDGLYGRKIVDRRLALAKEVFSGDRSSTERALKRIQGILDVYLPHAAEEQRLETVGAVRSPSSVSNRRVGRPEDYFVSTICPLFNFNMKKIIPVMISSADETNRLDTVLIPPPVDHSLEYEFDEKYRFGLGGQWMHDVSTFLRRNDFARRIFSDEEHERRRDEDGHCLISRMVLTVISNRARYDHTSHRMGTDSYCSLAELLDSLAGVCWPNDVLDRVEYMFQCHKEDWVHLLSIGGKRLRNTDLFREERVLLGKCAQSLEYERWGVVGRRLPIKESARNKLSRIKLRITPAGFMFIKRMVVHFEFYSHVAENRRSLFSIDGLMTREAPVVIEDHINRVHGKLQQHLLDMKAMFENRYMGRLGISADEYKTSDLCFKYLGPQTESRRAAGNLHSFRLINSMIHYLDNYRVLLVCSGLPLSTRRLLNSTLASKIEDFVQLFDLCPDPAAGPYKEVYLERVMKLIGDSGDEGDFVTRIRVPYRGSRRS